MSILTDRLYIFMVVTWQWIPSLIHSLATYDDPQSYTNIGVSFACFALFRESPKEELAERARQARDLAAAKSLALT